MAGTTLLYLLILPCVGVFGYEQQHVLDSRPSTQTGVLRRFTEELENVLSISQEWNLDLWHASPDFIDVFTPENEPLPEALSSFSFSETPLSYSHPTPSFLENTTFHEAYHPQHEVDRFIHQLAHAHGDLATIVPLGHSAEGREMWALKLHRGSTVRSSRGNRQIDPSKKLGFVIMGTLHAREWIATAASLFIADSLVANASEPHSLNSLLDVYDFYVVPSPNPDGYAYTWESDRLWYKNRQIMGPSEQCVGLDLNRNWGYKWKPYVDDVIKLDLEQEEQEEELDSDLRSSGRKKKPKKPEAPPADPCSHWFPGHRAFESPENNNLANFITTLPNLVAFLDLRSYGQMLSAPYSYSCKRYPKDSEDIIEAAHGAAQAIKSVHSVPYITGRLCETLYPAPGNVVDWMYQRAGIKYSYAVHLRDTGTYGFSLPPEWIRPVGEETVSLVRYLAQFIGKQLKRM